jgi:hypothetical protein
MGMKVKAEAAYKRAFQEVQGMARADMETALAEILHAFWAHDDEAHFDNGPMDHQEFMDNVADTLGSNGLPAFYCDALSDAELETPATMNLGDRAKFHQTIGEIAYNNPDDHDLHWLLHEALANGKSRGVLVDDDGEHTVESRLDAK